MFITRQAPGRTHLPRHSRLSWPPPATLCSRSHVQSRAPQLCARSCTAPIALASTNAGPVQAARGAWKCLQSKEGDSQPGTRTQHATVRGAGSKGNASVGGVAGKARSVSGVGGKERRGHARASVGPRRPRAATCGLVRRRVRARALPSTCRSARSTSRSPPVAGFAGASVGGQAREAGA